MAYGAVALALATPPAPGVPRLGGVYDEVRGVTMLGPDRPAVQAAARALALGGPARPGAHQALATSTTKSIES